MEMGKQESRLCGGTCGNELHTEGYRDIRCGRVWKGSRKASGPNRQTVLERVKDVVGFDTKGGPRGDGNKEWNGGEQSEGRMVQEQLSLHGGEGGGGRKEEMWGKKDMTRKGSQNKTTQCKTREGQRQRNIEDEGIRSRCGASHGNT